MTAFHHALLASRNKPQRTTDRGFQVVSVSQAKNQLNIQQGISRFDDQLADLITEAQDQLEIDTPWVGSSATYTLQLDAWPTGAYAPILIPQKPVQSITSIQYYDTAGTQQVWSSGDYRLDLNRGWPVIWRADLNDDWPDLENLRPQAISITYLAGYSTLAVLEKSGGQWMRQAILARLAMLWHDRGLGLVDVLRAERVYAKIIDRRRSTKYL